MDIWDWLKGLRTWWWMIIAFPLLAATITWIATPDPQYESTWTANVLFDDPERANVPSYFDFIFLDDFAELVQTSVFGDIIYLRLPQDVQDNLSREEFGEMVSSTRRGTFVEITVKGDDPAMVSAVAEAVSANAEEVANQYIVPPTYVYGPAKINILDPITEPALNDGSNLVTVGAITGATLLVSIAATGVAEWLRMSYRSKNAAK